MNFKKFFLGEKKNYIIVSLFIISFIIILPTTFKIYDLQFNPLDKSEISIKTVSYRVSSSNASKYLRISGHLYNPIPHYSNESYPVIITFHDFHPYLGNTLMKRWCMALVKRGFIVLSIDLPGYGSSIGQDWLLPDQIQIIDLFKSTINYLKSLSFTNTNSLGLLGLGYGGYLSLISSGLFKDMINATVSLNCFANTTQWFVNYCELTENAKFSYNNKSICLEEINGNPINSNNIDDLITYFKIYLRDATFFQQLFIAGTNELNVSYLESFNALNFINEIKNNSLMMIHGINDNSYGFSNQSGIVFNRILNLGKKCYYVPILDNHLFDSNGLRIEDFVIINFFEEKLLKINLGNNTNLLETYGQARDISLDNELFLIEDLLIEFLTSFIISFIPFFIIVYIISLNKKYAKERSIKEKEVLIKKKIDNEYVDLSFGRGDYRKNIFFLGLLYFVTFIIMPGSSLGFFSSLINITLIILFYVLLLLVFYHIPDKAEVELWNNMKYPNRRKNETPSIQPEKLNKKYILITILTVFVLLFLFSFISFIIPNATNEPLEIIIKPLLINGTLISITSLIFILFLQGIKSRDNINIIWDLYGLDKYINIKGFTFGSLCFLNFLFQWNIYMHFLKFPMLTPTSPFYFIEFISITVFFVGIQLFSKIIHYLIDEKQIRLYFNDKFQNKFGTILSKCLIIGLDIIIFTTIFSISFLFYLEPIMFDLFFFYIYIIFFGFFIINSILSHLRTSKDILGFSLFFPLTIITILLWFFHF